MRQSAVVVSILVAVSIFVGQVRAQPAEVLQPTVLIVDSSASMSARVRPRVTRLDEARDVLLDAMRGWREDTQLAVLAYGHRRAGDCDDIETVIPFGQIDIEQISERFDALRARGKTPLASSLEAGAKLLPAGGGAIVLVSDGVETCEADPCAVARNLHRADSGVVVHVISFGVTEEERRQLDCIASGGGGRLLPASNATELTAALRVISRMAGIAPQPPQGNSDAPGETRLGLTLLASEGMPLYEIMNDGEVAWTVHPLDASGPMRISDLRSPSFALEPGPYRVTVRFGDWMATSDITVSAGEMTEASVDLRLGRVVLEAASTPQGPVLEASDELSWELAKAEEAAPMQSVISIARPTLIAQEGDYEARLKSGGKVHTAPANVVAGETVVVRVLVPPAS